MPDLLNFANLLADSAASVTTRYFGTGLESTPKADSSPVTLADREAESAMRALIVKTYPTHGIFGEEGERINPEAPSQWVLDPIDGTKAFIAGETTFTTLIAYTESNISLFGIIDQPILKQRFIGQKNKPTTLNGTPIHASNVTTLKNARIATTSTSYFTDSERSWFNRLTTAAKTHTLGGDAYAYAMLANGQLDAVVDVDLKWYDLAALIPVIEGAGGVVQVTQKDNMFDVIAASTPALLQEIIPA